MVKLLSTISIILVLILFPPSILAVISNNAVLGDATYPIKRFLEDGIYEIASLNSVSKAWFAAARSDRRFKEFSTLIAQGKSTEKTINELVSQTEMAANQLEGIKDPIEKEKFAKQLVESIQKYDQGLAQVEPTVPTPKITPTPTLAPKPTNTPLSIPGVTPVPSLTPSPIPTSQPVVSPPSSTGDDQAAEDARKRLKEIEDELKKKGHIKLNNKDDDNLTPKKENDKIKKDKSDERDSHPRAGDDESSRQQRNSLNKK